MHRYQILMEYVGTNFYGWQYQKKQITIQGTVQKVLKKILNSNEVINVSRALKIEQQLTFQNKKNQLD